MQNKKSFESSLNELETLVKNLESGELPLEQALSMFETGVKLYKKCKGELDKADKKITMLTASLKEEQITDKDG